MMVGPDTVESDERGIISMCELLCVFGLLIWFWINLYVSRQVFYFSAHNTWALAHYNLVKQVVLGPLVFIWPFSLRQLASMLLIVHLVIHTIACWSSIGQFPISRMKSYHFSTVLDGLELAITHWFGG